MIARKIYDFLFINKELKKGKVAIKDHEIEYSYSSLIQEVNKLADYFTSIDIGRYTKMGIKLNNGFAFAVTLFACSKVGAIAIPINEAVTDKTFRHLVKDSRMNFIVSRDEDIYQINTINVTSISISNNKVNLFEIYDSHISGQNGYENSISIDLAMILYTSGSTGNAKGVMITNGNLVAGTQIVVEYLEIMHTDVILSILPFSFDYGLNQLLTAIYSSGQIVIKYPYLIREIPRLIETEGITGLAGVPSIWINLLTQKNISRYNYSRLRYITNSGDCIPNQYLRQLKETFIETKIYLMYGLTECFRCSYLSPNMYDSKPGSMGKAIPDSEIFIVNEHGNICKNNEVGELIFRGPTVSMGYLNEDQTVSQVFKKNPFNPFYKELVVYSGDLVYQDEDGYIFYVDRKDQLIKNRGHRVNPKEVAEELLKNDFIKECCVVSMRDFNAEMNKVLTAFITIDATINSDEASGRIKTYARLNLPYFMFPERIIVLDELPRLSNRKYDYTAMKNWLNYRDTESK